MALLRPNLSLAPVAQPGPFSFGAGRSHGEDVSRRDLSNFQDIRRHVGDGHNVRLVAKLDDDSGYRRSTIRDAYEVAPAVTRAA